MIPTAHITPKLESIYEDRTAVLECQGSVYPVKPAAQLAFGDYITVDWFGIDGELITGTEKINSNIGSTRTLTVKGTSIKHTGLYTCQVTLDLPKTSESHVVITQHHLVLLSEFINLPYLYT